MTTTKTDEGARAFVTLLASLGEGAFHAECSEELLALNTKLASHAENVGKAKGTITVTLAVEIDRDGVATVDPDVKVKAPKPARSKGRFWLTKGNNLSPEHPRQQRLPLREVTPPRETRAIDDDNHAPARGV